MMGEESLRWKTRENRKTSQNLCWGAWGDTTTFDEGGGAGGSRRSNPEQSPDWRFEARKINIFGGTRDLEGRFAWCGESKGSRITKNWRCVKIRGLKIGGTQKSKKRRYSSENKGRGGSLVHIFKYNGRRGAEIKSLIFDILRVLLCSKMTSVFSRMRKFRF